MKRTKNMKRMMTAAALALLLVANRSLAVSYYAENSGPADWSQEGTWTPAGGPPVSGDVAYIGHSSGALSAAVDVTNSQGASYIRVGYGNSAQGTLDIESGGIVTVGHTLDIGSAHASAVGVLNLRDGGTLDSGYAVNVGNNATGTFNVEGGTLDTIYFNIGDKASGNGTVNLNGNTLTCGAIFFGRTGGTATLNRGDGGTVEVKQLVVYNGTFKTAPGDVYSGGLSFSAEGANAVIELGADLDTTGISYTIARGGRIDLNGHDATANYVYLDKNGVIDVGANLFSAANLIANNHIAVDSAAYLQVGGGRMVVNTKIDLKNSRDLTVTQDPGTTTGLELNNDATAAQLSIADGCVLQLEFDEESTAGQTDWLFRWKNPSGGGDRVSDLEALFTAGKIAANLEYKVIDGGEGYTYIMAHNVLPGTVLTIF